MVEDQANGWVMAETTAAIRGHDPLADGRGRGFDATRSKERGALRFTPSG
jgi:hypothetical protein